tara:strand:+ start:4378 stop:4923 length:546 start_codon:yes stop_codon:yes gene_type:complete
VINNRNWIALFSQTGSEIVNISKSLSVYPDLVITNKLKGSDDIHQDIEDNLYLPPKPNIQDYRNIFNKLDNPIITLHGWMRIIPGEICNDYDIYNLHPGLINMYPELKGKDPQRRVFDMLKPPKYVGCVIHKAVEEVDAGKIILSDRLFNHYNTPNQLITTLHEMACNMWCNFFTKQLYVK